MEIFGKLAVFGENFEANGGDAVIVEADAASDARGDVDDASADVGAAVGNFHDFGFAIAEVHDANASSEGESFVRGGGLVIAEAATAGGGAAEIGFDGVPRCHAFLNADGLFGSRLHDSLGFLLRSGSCGIGTTTKSGACEGKRED